MPAAQKSISFTPEVYDLISSIAEQEYRSPAKQVEWVFKQYYGHESPAEPVQHEEEINVDRQD